MTIDKAIELLTQTEKPTSYQFNPDLKDALKLGIEALKRRQDAKGRIKDILGIPLPGETKD